MIEKWSDMKNGEFVGILRFLVGDQGLEPWTP